MRDERFKAVHRGGLLEPKEHRLFAAWAADCAEHVLPLFSKLYPQDNRPLLGVETARAWSLGEATVAEARAASVAAHAAARDASEGAARAVARAAGHAVATAHMADHALGAAIYAIKAVQAANADDVLAADRERAWQQERLPKEIRALVLSAITMKKFRALGTLL